MDAENKTALSGGPGSEFDEKAWANLATAHSLVNKSYLAELNVWPVETLQHEVLNRAGDVRVFHVERLVHDNKSSVLESAAAAYSALGAAGHTIFTILISDGIKTDLYIGAGRPGRLMGREAGELLHNTFKGHFPGSSLVSMPNAEVDAILGKIDEHGQAPGSSITSVTGVPALSTDSTGDFVQGIERFVDAAEGRVYQAIILAEPVSAPNLDTIRSGYEQIATLLSPLMKRQLSYGMQESDAVGRSISMGLSEALGESLSLTETWGGSETLTNSTTETRGTSESCSRSTAFSRTVGWIPLVGGSLGGNASTSTSSNHSSSSGSSASLGTNHSESRAKNSSKTTTSNSSDTDSITRTTGSSKQLSVDEVNKTVERLIGRIDHHLDRIDEAKTYGGWNAAAYFIGDSTASSEALGSIFLGLIRGSKSSHESFAITTWNSREKAGKEAVAKWIASLEHPRIKSGFSGNVVSYVTPATLVSGKELAVQMSLPRRSTSTVSVVETQAFGRKVQYLDDKKTRRTEKRTVMLGSIRHLWENMKQEMVLSLDDLSGHVFVSGSTGAGKSNTLYEMLNQVSASGVPFMVIEPAKGEYKHVFGHRNDVSVLGTNPEHSDLLRISPFRFPDGIHVLEHIDRLVEIFNVCWPMYAAMPAVLKDAILQAYEQCGWDLEVSVNRYCIKLFPSFLDLLEALEQVIDASSYSQEIKGNYIGSLSTRVKSLTNGLNGLIFTNDEIDSEVLFEKNVIVDLSRVGSSETKALIMGILVMRLSEHRIAKGGMNQPLKHVTVLEEAHHILKRSSGGGGMEGADLAGKSVEMLASAIAEMRTYGEGFFIVDQSPHAVDIAAIRNTNTKIIMRLPDEADRRLIGKSVALRDEQLEEIAKLPKGVAIVYQNDWLEPVLCQIKKFDGEVMPYAYTRRKELATSQKHGIHMLLGFLLSNRLLSAEDTDLNVLERCVSGLRLPARSSLFLYDAIRSFRDGCPVHIQENENFGSLSRLVTDILGCRDRVIRNVLAATDYTDLHYNLNYLVLGLVPEVTSQMALTLEHCLLKDYSLQSEENVKIYAAWKRSLEGDGLL